MSKYDFILHTKKYQSFIDKVRDLGLVDITTSSWVTSEEDRDLLLAIEGHLKAEAALQLFAESESFDPNAKVFESGVEAYEAYVDLKQKQTLYNSEIARLDKIEEEMRPWGDFSVKDVEALASRGVIIRYFVASESIYEESLEEWAKDYTISLIARNAGLCYFVVISREGEGDVMLDAQEMKNPTMTATEASQAIESNRKLLKDLDAELSKCAASLKKIEDSRYALTEKLQESKVKSTAESAADGSLLVMEAWAEESTSSKVDALLEEFPGVIYIKSNPTPEDATPVKLRNKWFASTFELIGNMYALPKYGSIDLTPFFAPFYMLFFAICLCDAGYGLFILAAGLGLYFKGGDQLRQASWLSIICGVAAVVFGFLANSFFGMEISSAPMFENFKFINFQSDFFSMSMIIGVIQILFGMIINIYVTTRTFGVKYALGTIGWCMLLVSCIASYLCTEAGISGFGFSSIPFYILAGIATVLMLGFNSPDKNIFANIAPGLWDTYNNITGLLGDVLSYIRLFAIGLSGGVLALVFNSLAMGMTGLDAGLEGQSWWSIALKVFGAAIILIIGHGINLFMSTISSVVHPMRLTFVEFFKNAGFEMSTREFEPLQKRK